MLIHSDALVIDEVCFVFCRRTHQRRSWKMQQQKRLDQTSARPRQLSQVSWLHRRCLRLQPLQTRCEISASINPGTLQASQAKAAFITRHQQLLVPITTPLGKLVVKGILHRKASFVSSPGVQTDCSGPAIDSKNARQNID